MKIEQRDLEYFAVVAEHGNIGRAAEALELSQPALSMSLRRLERATGSKIVRRTAKGVELTEAGAALLTHVSRLRLVHDDILKEVSDIGQGRAGHLRIGTSVGLSDVRLASACSALLRETPRVTFSVIGGTQAETLPLLRAGELDLLLTSAVGPDAEDMEQEHVIEDEFVAYCSRRHRLARAKRVTCADLVRERWVLAGERNSFAARRLRAAFEQRGLPPPTVAVTSVIPEFRLRIVAATDLLGHHSLALVQEASRRLPVTMLRIEDWEGVRRSSAIIYRKGAYLSPAARRLIDILKKTVKEIAKEP
jgi:DNA-binding transcriptional LysR family regulator